jgi:hypothetical protein
MVGRVSLYFFLIVGSERGIWSNGAAASDDVRNTNRADDDDGDKCTYLNVMPAPEAVER